MTTAVLRAAAILGLAALPAAAQQISSTNPQSVAIAMQAAGYRALLETTSNGHPVIRSSADGLNFDVHFDMCTNGQNCAVVYFSSGFNLAKGSNLDAMNAWNQGKLVGRAYLDTDKDPYLDYVIVGDGGLTDAGFSSALSRWTSALSEFARHIGWR